MDAQHCVDEQRRDDWRSGAALAGGLIEDDGAGGGDVERADAAGHGNAQQVVAGAADEIVEAGAFAAEDEDAVAGEVEAVVVGCAALVETDDPEVLPLQVFERADEVDDAGDAEMLGGAGAGFDGDGAQRGGAALGEDDAVDAGAIGHAQQRAEVLRIFDAVEGEEQARLRSDRRSGSKRSSMARNSCGRTRATTPWWAGVPASWVSCSRGFLADADAGLAAIGDEAREAVVVALAGDEDVVEAAPAGFESFLDRMQAVENFHEG